MKLTKYPSTILFIAGFIVVMIVATLCYALKQEAAIIRSKSDVTVDLRVKSETAPPRQIQTQPVGLTPFLPGIIQAAGLIVTVLLAFLPIQSLAFHQGKKQLLEEILSMLSEYESSINEVSDSLHAHQRGEWSKSDDGNAAESSRAAIALKEKKAQALLKRIQIYLPLAEANNLATAGKDWWKSMIGEDAYVMKREHILQSGNPTFLNMNAAHFKYLDELCALRQKCIFDECKYWDLRGRHNKDTHSS